MLPDDVRDRVQAAIAERIASRARSLGAAVDDDLGRKAFNEAATHLIQAVRSGMHAEEHPSPEESRSRGKALRKQVSRGSQGVWEVPADRENPIDLLKGQATTREPGLVPIRYQRMAASPFAYFRGAALPMASDLSHTPSTGITVQACGDAHVANFGIFASPERHLVFDINDFDETLPGPWEWDLKRLAASLEVCGRERGFSAAKRRSIVIACAESYRQAMQNFSEMGNLDTWYSLGDVEKVMENFAHHATAKGTKKTIEQTLTKARRKNNARAINKFTEVVDGKLRVISDSPLIVPLRDLWQEETLGASDEEFASHIIKRVIDGYRRSLPPDRRRLIDMYHGVDMAHKVVGVGSVGLQAWIIVLEGSSPSDALVLQAKEAQASVLERYVGKSQYLEHGRRVVEGQRAMQTASDIMLGWTRQLDDSGKVRDYYIRQLWDSKGSPDLETITADALEDMAKACAWALAHAHARTGDRFAIAAYLGRSDTFDRAMADFAAAYADQNDADYQAFL